MSVADHEYGLYESGGLIVLVAEYCDGTVTILCGGLFRVFVGAALVGCYTRRVDSRRRF